MRVDDHMLTSQDLRYLATGCHFLALHALGTEDLEAERAYVELAAKCERLAALADEAQ
jgi:hypothetical protein